LRRAEEVIRVNKRSLSIGALVKHSGLSRSALLYYD